MGGRDSPLNGSKVLPSKTYNTGLEGGKKARFPRIEGGSKGLSVERAVRKRGSRQDTKKIQGDKKQWIETLLNRRPRPATGKNRRASLTNATVLGSG